MNVMKQHSTESIDQIEHRFESTSVANIVLELGGIAMRFSHVDRTPRYDDGRRENDVEHSFMLSLVATEIAVRFYPNLDAGLVAQFANVHDLPELKTQDVATFNLSDADLRTKEAAEHDALPAVLRQLPPYTRHLLKRYEEQREPEARIVRAIDKLLPVMVDIYGEGQRVMAEDYNIHSIEELQRCQGDVRDRIEKRFGEFPEIVLAYEQLADMFQLEFTAEV